ncbi:MAG: type II toxin-antitoxin system RelE/ParE family toxin [Clostridiales bacterium]|jgi:addiction module RelE/StbE family toxin|nr:type II toxin-antitoxin system RelE/ParE family toxin [Clostridiales bacterium]
MYKVVYLPLALNDLREITDYITDVLKAPKAAIDLVDALDDSILKLGQFPYSCRVYQTTQHIETVYRLMPVKNYLVFYAVHECEVEIHRIIYAKMNLEKIMK